MLSGILAIFLGAFAGSGIVPSVTKFGLQYSAPIVFVFFRFLFATALFLPIFFFTKKTKLTTGDYTRLLVLAFLWFANVTAFTTGVNHTTVLMSQLLYLPAPIVVSILGHFFLHERLNRHKIIGLLITLFGIGFLLYQSASKSTVLTFGTPIGNGIILVAMFAYSGWVLYSRSLAKQYKYSSYQTTFFTFLFVAAYLFMLIPFQQKLAPSTVPFILTGGIILAVVVSFASVVQYLFLQIGIKRTSAFTVSIFQYVGPVFAGIVSIPLLHEKPSLLFLIGGLIIMSGVFYATTFDYLASRKNKK